NPLDPAQVCQAVSKALRALDMDIRCKVILLKHLDRTVIVELKNIYSLANELMINAGILPQNRFGVKKQASPVLAGGTATSPEQAGEQIPQIPAGTDVAMPLSATQTGAGAGVNLGQVLSLFQQLRQSGVRMPNAVSRPVTATSAPVQPEQLIDALTSLQLSADYLEQPHLYNVRSVIERVLNENRSKGKPDALNQSDEDIINLVAM